jgi:hypothetical protein
MYRLCLLLGQAVDHNLQNQIVERNKHDDELQQCVVTRPTTRMRCPHLHRGCSQQHGGHCSLSASVSWLDDHAWLNPKIFAGCPPLAFGTSPNSICILACKPVIRKKTLSAHEEVGCVMKFCVEMATKMPCPICHNVRHITRATNPTSPRKY